MGYTHRSNGAITDFWPDNTETELYLTGDHSLAEILELAGSYFRDHFYLDKLIITSEYIPTSCLTYDLHDASDYTKFIKIRLEL